MRNSPCRIGSIHQASMQAVKRWFLTKWSYNGRSCTISPRARLTRMASSFMRRSSAEPIRPRVARVCTENLDSDVLMMQPADQGMRHNASDPLNWARDRRILSQGAMSSRCVVIARIGFYESAQVLLTQGDDMINTLASDRPNQPFHEAILPRRARRNGLVADTHGS